MTTKDELAKVGKNVGALIKEVRRLSESNIKVARIGDQVDRVETKSNATLLAVQSLAARFDAELPHLVTDGDLEKRITKQFKECREDRKRSSPPGPRREIPWKKIGIGIGVGLALAVAGWFGLPNPFIMVK